MQFIFENLNGKPVVKLVGKNPFVAEDLAALHEAVKRLPDVSEEESCWLGVCCVLFAAISLSRWGNQLNQTNILKTLDEFYFSFSEPRMSRAFQDGINNGIELTREIVQSRKESDIVSAFAAKLGC